jgi:hypothetical protein
MDTFGFGQRAGQIVQMAFVVKDMDAAIDRWVRDCGVGPWYLLNSFTGPTQVYRGRPATADIRLAMSFAGHMNIELIQPKDDHPSVFKEIVERRGFGFHHVGIAVHDVESERARLEILGYRLAFEAPVPSGGSVVYMGKDDLEPGFVELIPATPGFDEMFTRFWRSTIGWDGSHPVRPFT